jgi:branched-chain amino acid transport system permease protein
MLDNLIVYLQTRWTWLPSGFREAFPFLVIILAMVARGRSLPTRGAVSQGKLPFAPRPTFVWQGATILGVLVLLALLFLPFDWRQAIMVSLIGTVIALSFVVLTGYVAQISLAQMSTAGVGAFALTRLSGQIGIPFPFGGILAAVAAALIGILVGIPALRVRGVNLAVLTLAFAYAFQSLILDNADLMSVDRKPPSPSIAGKRFGPLDAFPGGDTRLPQQGYGIFLLVVAILIAVAVANMRRGSTGRQMLAVRTNERAAAAAGVGVTVTKLAAFGVSSFIAGVGGVLLAYLNSGSVNRDAFSVLLSVSALSIAYLGGITAVYGAVLAGGLTLGGFNSLLIEKLFHAGQWEQLFAGYALVFTAVMNPEGIAGAARHIVHVVRAKTHRAHPADAASSPDAVVTPA